MTYYLNLFKKLILLNNLIFLILGISLFYSSYNSLSSPIFEPNSSDKTFVYFCFIISAIVILISILGCCGIYYENTQMIKAYALLILICIALQVYVFFLISRIDTEQLSTTFKEKYILNYDIDSAKIKDFIDELQSNNKCCGIESYKDYKKLLESLPTSCCESRICTNTSLYKNGCKYSLIKSLNKSKKTYHVIISLTLGIQILIVIISYLLWEQIKEQYNV